MKKDRRTYIIDIRKLLRINMDKDTLINNGETTGKRRFNGELSEILAMITIIYIH